MIMCTLLLMVYGLIKLCWLTMSHVHVLKKLPYCLMCTCCFVDFIRCPTDKYMFKVKNNRFICMCSKLKINVAWHRSVFYIVDFQQFYNFFYCFNCWLWTGNYFLEMKARIKILSLHYFSLVFKKWINKLETS